MFRLRNILISKEHLEGWSKLSSFQLKEDSIPPEPMGNPCWFEFSDKRPQDVVSSCFFGDVFVGKHGVSYSSRANTKALGTENLDNTIHLHQEKYDRFVMPTRSTGSVGLMIEFYGRPSGSPHLIAKSDMWSVDGKNSTSVSLWDGADKKLVAISHQMQVCLNVL